VNRCDCQASLDGIFPDRHETTCATQGRHRNRDHSTLCGRSTRNPHHHLGVLYCGVTGDHTNHISYSIRDGAPLWEWVDGQPARPFGQKREAA
jgi:hypothetical protein